MYVKTVCIVILMLLISLGQRDHARAQAALSKPPDTSRRDREISERQRHILEWLHATNEHLEQQLTQTFWAWWQIEREPPVSPNADALPQSVARLKQTKDLLYWVREHIGELDQEQVKRLWSWSQQRGSGELDAPQLQMLQSWWQQSQTAAVQSASGSAAAGARIESKPQPMAQPVPPSDATQEQMAEPDQSQANIVRLEQEHRELIQAWMKAGETVLPSLQSPFATSGAPESVSPECLMHLREETASLARDGLTKEDWLHHVFECEACCGPLLATIMDAHVEQVIQQPHMVVLFDFDTYTIKEYYQRRLDKLMQKFDRTQDHILLIGRASNIGDWSYNIVLSGQRVGEIKDYMLDNFSLEDSRLHHLYFGYDPPQLTRSYAESYGVTEAELAQIDTSIANLPEHKLNQSVVVVIYKASFEPSAQR